MNESEVREAARFAAYEVLLAWLLSTQSEIDLSDTKAVPRSFVSMEQPDGIPEELHDELRTTMRDTAERVLSLAAIMRGALA
jgi:antibiotic biosynthesis monooxygenase (ABM) superfamily enzyme